MSDFASRAHTKSYVNDGRSREEGTSMNRKEKTTQMLDKQFWMRMRRSGRGEGNEEGVEEEPCGRRS